MISYKTVMPGQGTKKFRNAEGHSGGVRESGRAAMSHQDFGFEFSEGGADFE